MKFNRSLTYIICLVLLTFLWEFSASSNNTVRLFISSPSLVFEYFNMNLSKLLFDMWTTFYEASLGLLFATFFSLLTMTICFYNNRLLEFVLPIMITSQVIPLITLAPLFIIVFGTGVTAKILMAALLCYFPIFINFSNGVKLINKNVHELLLVYNASTSQKIRYVYFPLALPQIMTGLKIAATLAVIGSIVAEFAGSESGLGRNLFIASMRTEPDLMVSSLILCSLLGGAMFGVIAIIERKIGVWYIK